MKIPIEVHELENILHYEDVGLILTDFRNRIFDARPRCVHQFHISPLAECIFYHQGLNRIERDCDFFGTNNNGSVDRTRFSRFDDL